MDLRKLEIFVRVAQLRSFSQAASSLHMAQPAVSIAVRKLEEELQTTLFDRSGRQVKLTAEGSALKQRAHAILQQVEDLKHASVALNTHLEGELSLACPSMLATYFLPNLLGEFLTKHPGLKASVTQAGTAVVEQMLLEDKIEIGVTSGEDGEHAPDLELIPLVREEIVLCVKQDHPWAQQELALIEQLHETPMVVYESGYFIRKKLDQICAEQSVAPEFRMQTNCLPLLLEMVKQGLGCTVGLSIMARREPDIVGIPLSPPASIRLCLAKRRGRSISRANQAFLDWVAFTV